MIVSLQGSSDTASSRTKPVSLRPELQDKAPVLDGQAIINEVVVENTLMQNTSFNMDSFKENSSLIAGYPEGRIIQVTYYSQNAPITDTQSKVVDLSSWTKDDVHISWTEIRNFELRLPDEMNFEYDGDSNNCKVDGSALTFPGFMPKPGDLFIYGLRNGSIGIFYVSSISRLAMGQETYHKITYTLQDFLTPTYRDRLRRQAGEPWYFDKKKFLVGNYAFLKSTDYVNQKELTQLRQEIVRNYVDRFYNTSFSSFIRPDKVYDPYVVEFWNKKISFQECHLRPTQLLIATQNFHKTIWAVLCGSPIKDLRNVERRWTTETYVATFWGANITSLLGNKFLTVGNEEGAERPRTLDKDGQPIFKDTIPLFGQRLTEEEAADLNNRAMDDIRKNFYGGFLPFRKCAPHQHPVNFPMCEGSKCIECTTDADGHHHPVHKNKPPFPVLSNEELEYIWRRRKLISEDTVLSDAQMAEVRGYILWYRSTYPGTYSRKELEYDWRIAASIPQDRELTPEETAGLLEYIKSYRAQFQPILTNRELELIWRTQKRVPYDHTLTDQELIELGFYTKIYRDEHGRVPDDGFEITAPVVGSAITTEEIVAAGAVVYSDALILDISLTELTLLMEGKAPQKPEDPIPPDYVPTVYEPEYPRDGHQTHCHDVCHETCGQRPTVDKKKLTQFTSSYGLSNEFYLGSVAMDVFEKIVYDAITNKEINPSQVVDLVKQYLEWSDEDAFYRHLLSLYLIDKSLYWLRYHS